MSRRIVALGGGHGLYATLSAARRLTPHVTAVVTVADDGGSSGRLRSELDVVPPGDLRMALAALASDSPHGRLWATVMQHRFGGSGALSGHPIGNLLLAGLNEVLADPVAALDELGRILGVRGRVLPMCPIALQIEADVSGLETDPRMFRAIRGQVAIATTPGKVRRVRLLPGDPIGLYTRGRNVPAAQVIKLRAELDAPLWRQFLTYARNPFSSAIDSAQFSRPVWQVIGERVWPTLLLLGVSTVLATAIGIWIGIRAGWRPGSRCSCRTTPPN